MDPPDVAATARRLAAMARIQGPDPKAVKMRRHSFHLHQSGVTTLSSSAVLLPSSCGVGETALPFLEHLRRVHGHLGAFVVTVSSLVEPFLVAEQRNKLNEELAPKLIEGTSIDVLVEGEICGNYRNTFREEPQWLHACLLSLVNIPASSAALLSLLTTHGGSVNNLPWSLGWSLAYSSQKQEDDNERPTFEAVGNYASNDMLDPSLLANSATRIAILGIPSLDMLNAPNRAISHLKQGDFILVCGSPFGILSPSHFFNSISIGTVANCLPPFSSDCSLVMADIHCLPGTEGAAVFDKHGSLVGVLLNPLKQYGSTAEIQLLITWDTIATSLSKMIEESSGVESNFPNSNTDKNSSNLPGNYNENSTSYSKEVLYPSAVSSFSQKALSSVVLVTVSGRFWASGVVLNKFGLILTNAHLMEPWRFGKTSVSGGGLCHSSESFNTLSSRSSHFEDSIKQASSSKVSNKGYERIYVRVDSDKKHTWCNATVVYVSKGPLDVALLQIETVPYQLSPIKPEFDFPAVGASAHVIGHGLQGPQTGLSPSLTSGFISKVVMAPRPSCWHNSTSVEAGVDSVPVMLLTTAAVHPGASGGAVVNSHGKMIALITSNGKHGSGRTIPHLNFSIPCQSLQSIFRYSENKDPRILQELDEPNEVLASIWVLAPKPYKSPGAPQGDKNQSQKGSRFAKFISEWQAESKHSETPEPPTESRDKIMSRI